MYIYICIYRCIYIYIYIYMQSLLYLLTKDMFADFYCAINTTSVTFKRPSFRRRDTKNTVNRPSNNIGAVSCTRCFQDQTIIHHQLHDFFKHFWIFFWIFAFSNHTDIVNFLYYCQSLVRCNLTRVIIIYIIFFKSLLKFVRAFSKHCMFKSLHFWTACWLFL